MPYVYAEFILQNHKSCQVNGFLATFLLYLLEWIVQMGRKGFLEIKSDVLLHEKDLW